LGSSARRCSANRSWSHHPLRDQEGRQAGTWRSSAGYLLLQPSVTHRRATLRQAASSGRATLAPRCMPWRAGRSLPAATHAHAVHHDVPASGNRCMHYCCTGSPNHCGTVWPGAADADDTRSADYGICVGTRANGHGAAMVTAEQAHSRLLGVGRSRPPRGSGGSGTTIGTACLSGERRSIMPCARTNEYCTKGQCHKR
jgi:hypothetical protein